MFVDLSLTYERYYPPPPPRQQQELVAPGEVAVDKIGTFSSHHYMAEKKGAIGYWESIAPETTVLRIPGDAWSTALPLLLDMQSVRHAKREYAPPSLLAHISRMHLYTTVPLGYQ